MPGVPFLFGEVQEWLNWPLSKSGMGQGDRVVEGTGLENRRALTRTEGSNPSPSARHDIMRERLETLAKRGVATIAALASLALSASSHPNISPEQAKHTYVVGMGDSVASGAGLGNYDDTTTECQRSPEAYAWQLKAFGIPSDNITLVACRGAGPEHISNQQFDGKSTPLAPKLISSHCRLAPI